MRVIIIIAAVMLSISGVGQDLQEANRIHEIEKQLELVSFDHPGLNEPVQISLSQVSIQEFIRGIAAMNNLNVSVAQDLDFIITNNFSDAPAKQVFLFLCKEYSLDIDFTGSIMAFTSYEPPVPLPAPVVEEPLDIVYNKSGDLLSVDVKRDTLFEVAKRITEVSPYNVLIAAGLGDLQVSAFVRNQPFKGALESLALANGLQLKVNEAGSYILEEAGQVSETHSRETNETGQVAEYKRPKIDGLLLTKQGNRVSIRAEDVQISEIIMAVAYELEAHYYMFSVPESKTTLSIEDATFDEFLNYVFSGTRFTFKKSEQIYLIGERDQERLRTTELVLLENRTVESIQDVIPQALKKDVDIKEFADLNGLIISGGYSRIEEIKAFLRQVDLPVPVVLIDLMIVEVSKDFNVEAGLKLGLGGENVPESTTGSYNLSGAGVEATLNSNAINALLAGFTGPGFITLGALSPNFYASISALEANGIIKKKSTPKLATMNGSEASLSLGETTFYAETNNSFIGAQNPALSQGITYKPINADLSITIQPFVSGDEQITLNIDFTQSNFTNRIAPQAPPGAQNKNFSSKIRVRNGETILLGGLDEKTEERTGEGLPFIARIPVIKWLFGVNKKRDSQSQINIFIKPTVIY